MSWLNDELPAQWPSKDKETSAEFHISTSQSADSAEIAPTVAIQPQTTESTPPWKRAINPPHKHSSQRLTRLFLPHEVPQQQELQNASDNSTPNTLQYADFNQTSEDDVHTTTPNCSSLNPSNTFGTLEIPDKPVSRRLKVFGRPDTYTNERLGNLLSSMGRLDDDTDADLANNLQNEGRKVLQGLSRPPESSLDELEQQLTSQDTRTSQQRLQLRPEDTTSSSVSSSSQTLDTLQPKSTWAQKLGKKVSMKFSSEGFLKSAMEQGTPKANTQGTNTQGTSTLDKEANIREDEVSALGIPAFNEREDSAFNTFGKYRKPSLSTSDSHPSNQSSHLAFVRTPDSVAKKHLQFLRHASENRASSGVSAVSGASVAATETAPTTSCASSGTTSGQTMCAVDTSIAHRDVSFSAGYELLAQLIRERIPDIPLEELDSLDLNGCDLETVSGLDRFAPNLTTLFLNDNDIRSLNGIPFNLVHLDLSANKLSNVNKFPSGLVSTLILSNNFLTSLEPLVNLRALSSLDLSNNNLTTLKGVESLTALRTLNVRNNQLKSVDINLGMLVELDAANNELICLRLNAPNLETLDLEGNNVATLNDVFPNMRELNVRFNNAVIDFSGFHSLKVVLFDGNIGIRNFGMIAGTLETFCWEQPRGNADRELSYALLNGVRDLKLGGGAGKGWPFTPEVYAAQHLDLSCMGLRELPKEFPQMFPFLKSLNLSFNKLSNAAVEVLAQCRLERVSVFGNRLTITGEQLASQLRGIRVLDTRSQSTDRSFVRMGEFPTEKYMEIVDVSLTANTQAIKTDCEYLQWLDGKWTNNAGYTTITTRPGFLSALYPNEWNPPEDSSMWTMDATMAPDMVQLKPIDLVEAMYVHHWRARHT